MEKGLALTSACQHEKALFMFDQALEFYNRTGVYSESTKKVFLAKAYVNIATTQSMLNRFNEGLKSMHIAQRLIDDAFEKQQNPELKELSAFTWNNYASLLFETNEFDSAAQAMEKSVGIFEDLVYSDGITSLRIRLARTRIWCSYFFLIAHKSGSMSKDALKHELDYFQSEPGAVFTEFYEKTIEKGELTLQSLR